MIIDHCDVASPYQWQLPVGVGRLDIVL